MDKSNGTFRPVDFITEDVSAPVEMTRDDYADLFDEVNKLVAPYLSSIGLKPIEQIGNRVFPQNTTDLLGDELRGTRLALIYQTYRDNKRILADQCIMEVYLTEQGQWIVFKTWRKGADAVRLVRSREEFLEYYDGIRTDNWLHPGCWLIDGPQSIAKRTITGVEARLNNLRKLERQLEDWNRRYTKVIESDN